jgi:hypothetical protein
MKQRQFFFGAIASLLTLSMPLQAQTSVKEIVIQANELMKRGTAEDAEKAIRLYNRAKKMDPNVQKGCDDNIKKCQRIISKKTRVALQLSTDIVEIPFQGGDYQVGIRSNEKWNVEGLQEWIKTESYDKNSLVLQCREQNNSTRERVSNLTVKSGDYLKQLKVVQAAREEYIEIGATSLSFPSSGTTEQIQVESNAKWNIRSVPSWCKIERDDSTIRISVLPNDRVMERVEDLVIETPNKAVKIKLYQGAGEEHLTLSQNNIILPSEGGKHYLKVYTDADNWFIGDFPNWLNVQRIGKDSICIESGENIPNGQERSGSVQIKTGRQTAGVFVTQSPIYAINKIWWKRVNGSDFSLGVNASYAMPFVSTSAGGDYEGSVVDYSLGNSQENASYKSAVGYSVGLFADIRLGKNSNIFLMPGINFTQIKYQNEFGLNTTYTMPYNSYQYMRGDVQNAYKEEYSHTMIEVPILVSYRIPVTDISHVQLNLGPVLNFGLSSKMEFSGNTDSETMHLYDRFTNQPANNSNYIRHTAANADFNLYQPCVSWTESYTTGNIADINHHETFTESPLHRFNYGLRAGVAYEYAGLSLGVYYTMMLSNMANDNYWENKRWTVLNESNAVMKGYKQHIHTLEFKLAYTLRYIGQKKNNKQNK